MEIVQLVWSAPELRRVAGMLMIAYIVLTVIRIRRGTFFLCAPLAIAAAALAALLDLGDSVIRGFENSAIFMAFFGSIVLLRALADRRPEISRTRTVFAGLGKKEALGAYLVGAHVVGSVLVVGVLAIQGSILKQERDDETRRRTAEAAQRGLCLAPLWSPFWVAAAFTAQQIPGVPAWEIMSLGLCMAAVGLVIGLAMQGRGIAPGALWRAVRGYAPIIPAVALCALLIAALSGVAGLSTLGALIAATPVLAALVLAGGKTRARALAADTWTGCGLVRDEVVVVTTALVLGRILEAVIRDLGLSAMIDALALPPWAVIACVICFVSLTALAGIHQLVSIIVVLVAFSPVDTGVADLVMMEAALVGWAFASMVGVTAVSVATASAMFRVSRTQLIFGPNLLFSAIFGLVAIALLAAINGLLFAD